MDNEIYTSFAAMVFSAMAFGTDPAIAIIRASDTLIASAKATHGEIQSAKEKINEKLNSWNLVR